MALLPWRRATSTQRSNALNVPVAGELAVETDTGRLVVTDGVTPWSQLPPLARLVEVAAAVTSALASQSSVIAAAASLAQTQQGAGVQATGAESGVTMALVDGTGRALLTFGLDGTATFPKAVSLPPGTVTVSQLAATVQAGLGQVVGAEAGITFAITDAASRTLLTVALDGTVTIPKLAITSGSITQQMLSAALQAALPVSMPTESGLIESSVDAAGRIYAGTRADGSRFAKGIPASGTAVSANYLVTTDVDSNGNAQLFSTARSTGVRTQLTTVGQNTSPVIDSADMVLFRSDQGRPADRPTHLFVPAAGGAILPVFSRSSQLYIPGDSLTAGTNATIGMGYPQQLALLLSKPVINDGVGGQTSEQIAARQGGTPATVTFSSNTITATTSAQTVTASLDLLYGAAGAFSRTGTIGGVHGTLTATGQNTLNAYTFTRDTAGTAVALTGPTAFIPDTVQYRPQMMGFLAGRNNFKTDTAAQIVADITSMVTSMTAYSKRFWVLSIPPFTGEETTTPANVAPGGVRYQLDAANAAIAAAFPNNWIDTAAALRTDAAFTIAQAGFPAAGITKTSQDATDISNGVTPTTFRTNLTTAAVDGGHFNDYGYYVVAYLVRQFLTQKGWL